MNSGRRRVKLYTYQKTAEEMVIDSYEAEKWEDYLIVHVRGDDEQLEYAAQMFNAMQALQEKYEHIILLPEGVELEFYGVEEYVESE